MDLTTSWGDEVVGMLPPPEESGPDADGVRTVIKYRTAPDGSTERVTQRIKTVTKTTRQSRGALRRRGIAKFGAAAIGSGENVTYVAADEVHIEAPGTAVNSGPAVDPSTQAMFACRHCGRVGEHWSRMCPYKELIEAGGTVPDAPPPDTTKPTTSVASMMGGTGGLDAYVPPSMREGGGSSFGGEQDDSARTLKVTNLSKDAEKQDLYDLFGRFGSIERVTLVRDRDTGENRGMAFVCFRVRDDAAEAKEALHGHPYEYQILSVEWARPRSERQPTSLSEMKVSGYGKALPQGLQ